jgi:hypothetical protein
MEERINKRLDVLRLERDRVVSAYNAAIAELEALLVKEEQPAPIEYAEAQAE